MANLIIDLETTIEKWARLFTQTKNIEWPNIKTVEDLSLAWEEKEESKFVFFPRISPISTDTIGQDLVSVQPMPAPIGHLYYMDVYSSNKLIEEKNHENKGF